MSEVQKQLREQPGLTRSLFPKPVQGFLRGLQDAANLFGDRTGYGREGTGVLTGPGKGLGDDAASALSWVVPEEASDIPMTVLGGAALGKLAIPAAGALYTGDAEAGVKKATADLLNKGRRIVAKQGFNADTIAALDALKAGRASDEKSAVTKMIKEYGANPQAVRRDRKTNWDEPIKTAPTAQKAERKVYARPSEAFKPGDVLVPISADTTRAGEAVTRAGIDLPNPVQQEGGPDFARLHPEIAWASNKGAAAAKMNNFGQAERLLGPGGEVKGLHVAMAPEGSYFALHPSELYLQQAMAYGTPKGLQQQFLREGVGLTLEQVQRAIAKRVGSGADEAADVAGARAADEARQAVLRMPSMEHPDFWALLQENPELRKALMNTGAKAEWQGRGMPLMDITTEGFTDPRFLGAAAGETGGAIVRPRLGGQQEMFDAGGAPLAHRSYDTMMPGSYLGELGFRLPASEVFVDAAEQMKRRGREGSLLGSLRAAPHMQPVTQDLLRRWDELTLQGGQ
jgi:hypothetical protein